MDWIAERQADAAESGTTPAPRTAHLWDEIPEGCEVVRCNACLLVYLSGPGQTPHFPYCPEGDAKVRFFPPIGMDTSRFGRSTTDV